MLGWGNRLRIAGAVCALAWIAAPGHAIGAPRTRAQIEADIRRAADEDAAAGQRKVDVALQVFTDEAQRVAMERREIMTIYQEEYRIERSKHQPGPWDAYKFQIMTAVAIIASVIAIFRKSLEDALGKALGHLGRALYERYAGSKLLRRFAMKKYHRRLVDRLAVLRLPFRPDRPIAMRDIYVPLRVADSRAGDAGEPRRPLEDAFDALVRYRRLVVLGAPGAGKSMLLKHIALTYAERLPNARGQPIPVLIELHRLAEPNATIEREIVAELGRTGFPRAETFVAQNLKNGSFLLLLDGLDEMTAAQRRQAARSIKDLAGKHESLRIVVTCRVAVYKGELDDTAEQRLELVDFNDHQIRRFLRTWAPTMPPGKSVEELLKALAYRPQIKKLAGNPLLLTIIAYLYADHPDMVLPHSRSQFYRAATDQLLERWHHEHNQFTLPQKRAILEHLALFNQSGTDPDDPDRRTMDFRVVTREAQALCPSLNIKPEDAGRVLQEIVERSGLLLAIDGGQRYCFAHLTLQEYFTAAKLQQEPERILQNYQTDRDGWRETLRLWCGLAPDSTDVIGKVRAVDPVMSFECLADAQKVSSELADAIVTELERMLGTGGADGDRIQAAFGIVAADPRPRGLELFSFLVDSLADAALRPMAASALAQTNLVRAANALGEWVQDDALVIRAALIAMGDLAVPTLVGRLAERNMESQVWVLDDLRAIGTPRVAEALVPLLWHESNVVAFSVALVLCDMLRSTHIEAALGSVALSSEHRASREALDWVWKPFAEREGSSLPIIVGRIAYLVALLVDADSDRRPAHLQLDDRVVISVCIAQLSHEPACAKRLLQFKADLAEHQLKGTIRDSPVDSPSGFAERMLQNADASAKLRALVATMAPACQAQFIRQLIRGQRTPTQDDWISMFRPMSYDIEKGWHLRVYILVCLSLCVPAFLELVWRCSPYALTPSYAGRGFAMLIFAAIIVLGLLRVIMLWPPGDFGTGVGVVLSVPGLLVDMIREIIRPVAAENRSEAIGMTGVLIVAGAWVPLVWYYGSSFMARALLDGVVVAWFATAAVCWGGLYFLARRMQNVSMNPLFGLWNDPREYAKGRWRANESPTAGEFPALDRTSNALRAQAGDTAMGEHVVTHVRPSKDLLRLGRR